MLILEHICCHVNGSNNQNEAKLHKLGVLGSEKLCSKFDENMLMSSVFIACIGVNRYIYPNWLPWQPNIFKFIIK